MLGNLHLSVLYYKGNENLLTLGEICLKKI